MKTNSNLSKHYVLGFLFNEPMTIVAMILKNKPAWQAGRMNGIGGKIESGESPLDAMRRECREELAVEVDDWREFGNFHGADDQASPGSEFIVRCFAAKSRQIMFTSNVNIEGAIYLELVRSHYELGLSNVNWLVPMAIEALRGNPTYFSICELPSCS